MMLNQGNLPIILFLLKGCCHVFAAGENAGEALQSMSGRVLNFDLNESPSPDIEGTETETNVIEDLVHDSHEKSIDVNSGLESNAAQRSSPVCRPSIQTSDFKMCGQSSNQSQAAMGEKKDSGPGKLNSCSIPAREAKTRLLTDLYQSDEVWVKSVPRSRRMRIPSKRFSFERFDIPPSDDFKTSQPATSSRRSDKDAEMHLSQGSTELQDSISNRITSRVEKTKRNHPHISKLEDLDEDYLPPKVYKTRLAAKKTKQEVPHKLLASTTNTSSPPSLKSPSVSKIKSRMGLKKELAEPDWDCSETQETSVPHHDFSMAGSVEDFTHISRESQLKKRIKLRETVMDWYRKNGHNKEKTAKHFNINSREIYRFVEAAGRQEASGSNEVAVATETRATYPKEFQKWAVKWHFENGLTTRETGIALRIPHNTIANWSRKFPEIKRRAQKERQRQSCMD